jgi:hypothetical protein
MNYVGWRRRHHPRRTRDSGRPHLNYVLRRHRRGRVRDLLRAIICGWSSVHCRCAHVPADFWFQCGRKRHLPDRRFRDPRRRRAHSPQRWIGRGSWRFAAHRFGIFPSNYRSRLHLRTGERDNRGSFSHLDWLRYRLFVLRFARRNNRAREMIGETVRFARDERHGLQVRGKCVAIPVFLVNSNVTPAHEIGMF